MIACVPEDEPGEPGHEDNEKEPNEPGHKDNEDEPGKLEYELNEDGQPNTVVGIGTYRHTELVIPGEHEGKKVTNVWV